MHPVVGPFYSLSVTPDQMYESWLEQLELIIQDVYSLHHHRHLYREVRDMAVAANLPPSAFFDALGLWYASSQAAALRRLVDRRRDTISLVRLLDDLRRNPSVLSRERHVELWGDDRFFKAEGHRNYDRFSMPASPNRLHQAAVADDIAAVDTSVERVQHYVNDHVAHRAAQQTTEIPTFAELHEAIDAVSEVVQKYASLLKAEILAELEPVIQYDWLAPFRRAWLTQ